MRRFITSPNNLGLAVAITITLALSWVILPDRAPAAVDHADVVPPFSHPEADTDTGVDTDFAEAPSPAPVDAVLVGQLANGMREIKRRRDGGRWAFCGEFLSPEEQVSTSVAIAYSVVSGMDSVGLEVSAWGIAATMYNESGFDPCALGIGPRSWAYEKGLLHRGRTHISHARENVVRTVNSDAARRRFSLTGFDLGLCQVLSRFYPGEDLEDMTTIAGSARICVLEMQARAQRHNTKTPWLYWRGTATNWYRDKLKRWGRLMGAPKKGI